MISLEHLSLKDFRSYETLDLDLGPGLTAVTGDNGNGKTNLIEALAFLARLQSFRAAPNEAMIRVGTSDATIRGEVRVGERSMLIEADISATRRSRVQVNKQRINRRGDLAEALTVSVFSPDDLELVKGSPGGRRDFIDDLLIDLHPKNEAACSDFAKVIKQRNALLKQMVGRRGADELLTLDVWDQRFVETGERLVALRRKVVDQLQPLVAAAYFDVSGDARSTRLAYTSGWEAAGLAAAIDQSRSDDLRRGVSTVGPHRDDIEMAIGPFGVRTHASQGEQRSMVLALRLAAHRLVAQARGRTPILLLDDVFSELDARRSAALLESLPEGQKILTTATALPDGAVADAVVRIEHSRIVSSHVGT